MLENETHIQRQVDIFITRNSFQTLTNVFIADPTCIDLVQCALTTTAHAMTVVTQNKTQSYIKSELKDDFIPLVIETYDCLHPCFDSFLISCVHASIA